MKSDVCSGLCLCLLLWHIVELHPTKQNSVTIISSVQNISDHSRVFLCHPFPNKAEHTPRHIITNFQWMTHPSCSTIPPLHRHHSSIRPSIHPAAQKKRCLFSSPPSSLPLSHSWNTVRRCKGAVFTRNYPPSITRHGIRGQAPARPPFRPAVTRGNYVLPGPLNRSRALGVEIEAPWWNSVLVVNARQPDVELPQPSDNDTFRHSAINWKSLAWLCLNRMHLVCPAPWAWGQAATWLMGGWSESKGSRRPFRGHGVYAMLEHNLSLINVKEGL